MLTNIVIVNLFENTTSWYGVNKQIIINKQTNKIANINIYFLRMLLIGFDPLLEF